MHGTVLTDTGMPRWDALLMCFTSTVSDHQPSFLFFPRITFWSTTGLAHWCWEPQFKLQLRQLSEQSGRECLLSSSREEQKHKRWNRLEQFGAWVGFHFQKVAKRSSLLFTSSLLFFRCCRSDLHQQRTSLLKGSDKEAWGWPSWSQDFVKAFVA